jgi:hypothetical protein
VTQSSAKPLLRFAASGYRRRTGRVDRAQGMSHARGATFYPQTQGKIERWQQTLKSRVLLES